MIHQQTELDEKRLTDLRTRYAVDMGRGLPAKLEQIKLQEMSEATRRRLIQDGKYSHRDVVLVGLTDGQHLLLPWEVNASVDANTHRLYDTTFTRNIRTAEQAEFQDQQFDRASQLYAKYGEEATARPQQIFARLQRARSLRKEGRVHDSVEEYRTVLATPSDLLDEHGVPFWIYAAHGLMRERDAPHEIVERLVDELNSPRWLLPFQAYMLRDLAKGLIETDLEPVAAVAHGQLKAAT